MCQEGGAIEADEIDDLIDLASSDPATALKPALEIAAAAAGDERAGALLAAGLAHRKLGNAAESVNHLTAAAQAVSTGSTLEARVGLSLAGSLGFVGRFDDAVAILDGLVHHRDELMAAQAEHQRATLFQRSGRSAEAAAGYERALATFEKHAMFAGQGHLHTNLSILHTYDGKIAQALTELDLAMSCYEQAGELQMQAMTIHNRGWTMSCTGNLPRALSLLEAAEERFAELNIPEGSRLHVRAEALFRAGLNERAQADLLVAIHELKRRGLVTDQAEALVVASRASTMAGRRDQGLRLADEAAALLDEQNRPGWRALAVAARFEAGAALPTETELVDLTSELIAAGHSAAALRILTSGADQALERGQIGLARSLLAWLPAVERTPAEDARLAAVSARLLARDGQVRQALEMCEAAYRRLDRLISGVGSLDLVAGGAYELDRLVQTAKRLIPESDPASYLVWAQRRRAVGACRWPANAAASTATLLNRYRAIDGQIQESPNDESLRTQLHTLQGEIEEAGWATTLARPTHDALLETIEGTVIDLSALDIDTMQMTVTEPGQDPVQRRQPLDQELIHGVDRLHQLWMGASDERESALADSCMKLARELESRLFDQVENMNDAVAILVDAEFRRLPFGCLPALQGRSLTIMPWRSRSIRRQTADTGRRLLIPDPDLVVAGAERRALQESGVWAVVPQASSIDDVVQLLSESEIVHISTHGGVEPENPLFNWLGLPSGRLYLYDLIRMDVAPKVVVIAACLGARSRAYGAAGALSFAEAFLGAGCQWVIASASVVPDDDNIARLLGDLHVQLAAGWAPDLALAMAKEQATSRGHHRAASAFACYSSG